MEPCSTGPADRETRSTAAHGGEQADPVSVGQDLVLGSVRAVDKEYGDRLRLDAQAPDDIPRGFARLQREMFLVCGLKRVQRGKTFDGYMHMQKI